MSGSTVKRLKSDTEWRITLHQTQGFRTLVDVVSPILTRVNFHVTKDVQKADNFFLCIDSVDPTHVCMVQARLGCEKTFQLKGDESFCVESRILNTLLKSVPPHYSLDLEKKTTSADIFMRTYESLSNSHETYYTLSTLVDESQRCKLEDMCYAYTIEIELTTLRQIAKMSQQLQAKNLKFVVLEPECSKAGVYHTMFSILSAGDAIQEHRFNSVTTSDPKYATDTCLIRAATDSTSSESGDVTRMIERYNESFSTTFMNYFLKSMERQMITLKLSNDKPLVLTYPLGADSSIVSFILAPKTDNED